MWKYQFARNWIGFFYFFFLPVLSFKLQNHQSVKSSKLLHQRGLVWISRFTFSPILTIFRHDWWNDLVWLTQAEPAGSLGCFPPQRWLNGNEHQHGLCCSFHSYFLRFARSVSLRTRPLCYDHVTWHRGPALTCVMSHVWQWDNRSCQCSESRILKSFPEDFCTFTEMLDNFLNQSKFKIHHMYIENMLSAKCSKIMSRWQNINKTAPGGLVPRGSWIFALYTLQCNFLSED